MRLADEGGRFGEHLMFVLAAEVDRVADAHDVDAVVDQDITSSMSHIAMLTGSRWAVLTRFVFELS